MPRLEVRLLLPKPAARRVYSEFGSERRGDRTAHRTLRREGRGYGSVAGSESQGSLVCEKGSYGKLLHVVGNERKQMSVRRERGEDQSVGYLKSPYG